MPPGRLDRVKQSTYYYVDSKGASMRQVADTTSTLFVLLSRFSSPLLASVLLLPALSATAVGQSSSTADLPDALVLEDRIPLEESEEVVNVYPRVTVDPDGRLVVADFKEGQIRLYSRDGDLLDHFGRMGSGPGEFTAPSGAVRLPGGQFLVADIDGTLHRFSADGDSVVDTYRTGLPQLSKILPVDQERVLLLTRGTLREGESRDLIHVWNVERAEFESSFFASPKIEGFPKWVRASSGGWPSASVRGDTVAVAYSVSDSLRFFSLDGRRLGGMSLPFRDFQPPSDPPDPDAAGLRLELQDWVETFDRIWRVFWRGDEFLVVYSRMEELTPKWRLLAVCRDGDRIFDARPAPRLLTLLPTGDMLFVDPAVLAPNVLRTGRLKSDRC